jgi:Flp pilus assembly protein TadB
MTPYTRFAILLACVIAASGATVAIGALWASPWSAPAFATLAAAALVLRLVLRRRAR